MRDAKERITISISCFVFVGILATFMLPQKWTSKSIVTPAEPIQWVQVQQMLVPLRALGVDVVIDPDDIFNNFLEKFSSPQVLEEYFTSYPTPIVSFQEKKNIDTMALHPTIVTISQQMKMVNNPTGKNDYQSYKSWALSFTGLDPRETQSILNNYINFVATQVVAQFLDDVRVIVALKIQTEKDALELEQAKLAISHDVKIKRLNYSLQVAKAAGIIRPVGSNGQVIKDDPDFPITLGADDIARQLAIEKSITDIAELVPELRNRKHQLSLLEKVDIRDMTFPVFKYQLPASLPVTKDGPGTAIVVLLATLTGGLLTCVWILLSEAWTQRST